MPQIAVRNQSNQEIRSISLPEEVFAAPLNKHMLWEVVRQYRNTARAGTHATKNRKDVSGGGKKPWKQKHTGRARAGSTRSPLWRHGGTVHGPQPHTYEFALPRKVRRGALRSALSEIMREGRLVVVDQIDIAQPKTKELCRILENGLGLKKSVLLVTGEEVNRNLALAARNNPNVKIVRPLAVNVYDLLNYDSLVVYESSLLSLAEFLSKSSKETTAGRGTAVRKGESAVQKADGSQEGRAR